MRRVISLTIIISLASCAPVNSAEVNSTPIEPPYELISLRIGDEVHLSGFVKFRGELMFYLSQNSKNLGLIYPYCISGTTDLSLSEKMDIADKKVRINAKVLAPKHNLEKGIMSTSILVDGAPIKNFCLSEKVLKVLSIEKIN